ncbi:PREDICTED: zygote arrest protein 1 [Haliaeetus leucocephalus]|uniref:zygote arrest protein 1 n=1 Tax=Haliaeetus leucocephalus TaxID=52644 RepID=UPI00053CE41D|nr:PREDICTED: zygote arrest protein 1 [Haliaeetus leucocephalus]
MESYLYAAYHPYSYRYPPPKGKGGSAGGWRPRGGGGGGYFSGYGEAAAAADYFDNYQRAQLKAILSQVNPNLTPRLRKANTKEVGVQVNPRQDASVQCSLGPRTLLRRRPVYFRQFCRTCQKSYNPYRVEDITCQSCKQTRCTCPVKMRHVDPKRPHRQDLCGRCKGKRLSCDSTFSFKYII